MGSFKITKNDIYQLIAVFVMAMVAQLTVPGVAFTKATLISALVGAGAAVVHNLMNMEKKS
jgi:uncharacterized membrane protein YgaE (UPF0421/DUF939 family)